MYAAADGGGGSGSSSAGLQVSPDELLAGAKSFDDAADVAANWLASNRWKLKFDPMGQDGVSEHLASSLGENSDGVLGAAPAVEQAVQQLRSTAQQMRTLASQYGITEQGVTSSISAQGAST